MNEQQNLTRLRFEHLLTAILERVMRIESRLDDVAVDVDAIDRFQRPYGDGLKTRQRGRR